MHIQIEWMLDLMVSISDIIYYPKNSGERVTTATPDDRLYHQKLIDT